MVTNFLTSTEVTMTSRERCAILSNLTQIYGSPAPGVSEKEIIHTELVRLAQEIVIKNPDSNMSPAEYMREALDQLLDSCLYTH